MSYAPLSDDQTTTFHADGFIILRNLLDAEEIELLRQIAQADHELARDAGSRAAMTCPTTPSTAPSSAAVASSPRRSRCSATKSTTTITR
jgi:hypothetical protein